MKPLSIQNIESELSYAYLHAVSAAVGVSCEITNRHLDNAGVDARLTSWGPFPENSLLSEVNIHVQLKATSKQPATVGAAYSYSLAGIKQYDDLRNTNLFTPRILVVLFLPKIQSEWLELTADSLLLRRSAHWVSLRGAKASDNATSQTVYMPHSQRFDGAGLQGIMSICANRNELNYSETP